METQDYHEIDDNLHRASSWSSAANWTVSGGSLASSVSFESSFSPIDDGEALNSAPGSSLILDRPTPDSGPCEITINLTQKHEVQQVYVRSTARVYEIYYAPDFQSGNEYLCTVRCSIAARDEVLHTIDNEEGRSNSTGSLKDPSEENSRNGTEDEWVDVKVPDTHVVDTQINSLPLKMGSVQEFYEATAQINDASPCVSLTLRLLSLERKDCACVGEVYIFADPVDSTDSGNQVSSMETSSGSSLMAMLVPTLLQFSKTRGVNRTEDKPTSDTWDKQNSVEIPSETNCSTSIASKVQEEQNTSLPYHPEMKVDDVNRDTFGRAQLQTPPKVPLRESKPESPPYGHVERAVDQLCSRISRIEDLFLRFEEKMLKPITSIEARLERVEQQLEVLTNKPENSGLPTCSRFYAPSFSCNESDSNSFHNGGNDYPRPEACESKDNQSNVLPTIPDDMSASVNSTQPRPSLVVTAPDFSDGDEEEEEDCKFDAVVNSSEDKPRPALTIDDALASALAGFMSLNSNQPEKAPEFPSEEDGSVDRKSSVRVEIEKEVGTDPSMCFGVIDVTESMKDSDAGSEKCSSENEGNAIRSDEHTDKTLRDDKLQRSYEGGEDGKVVGNSIENAADPVNQGRPRTDFFQMTGAIENGEVSTKICNIPVDITDNQLPEKQTDDRYDDNTQEDASTDIEPTTPKEVTQENSDDQHILKDILDFSRASSLVDFEIPVLDVKFTSQNSCDANYSLETLLGEFPESMTEALTMMGSGDAPSIGEGCNLILVENGEPVGPASDGNFSLDMDFYRLEGPSNVWGDPTCQSHEKFAASLI